MSAFVVDVSMALKWFLPDERSDRADQLFLLADAHGVTAPVIWTIELAHALLTATRRGIVPEAVEPEIWRQIGRLDLRAIQPERPLEILALAREHRLTAYGAFYLWTAVHARLPLATADADLLRAAEALGHPALTG